MLIAVISPPAHANTVTTERTEVSLISETRQIHAGQKFWTVLHIKLQPDWHTYWKNPGDSGIVPVLDWTLPRNFSAGEIQYLAPERLKVGPLVDYGYSNDAYYLVQVTPPEVMRPNETAILSLKAKWLVCKDVCIPETGEFSLILPSTPETPAPSEDAELVASVVSRLPVPAAHVFNYTLAGPNVHFEMPLKADMLGVVKEALFFPAQEGFINNETDQNNAKSEKAMVFDIAKSDEGKPPQTVNGVISFFLNDGTRKDYEVNLQMGLADVTMEGVAGKASLLLALAFAFLGGLILNCMPCVFPILFLKCLTIAKKTAFAPGHVRVQGFAYTAGVVLSFCALAVILIVLQMSGAVVGWGYQMQSPVFVASLAMLIFVVSLNLSGYFEFPVLFGSAGGESAAADSLMGSFLTGVLAVLVATPCTAPFMAPAIGFALTQDAPVILAIFTSIGLGLAAPFLLLSLFPGWINILPRPGVWMITFKQLVAFPMYITCVWLLWVLAREAGADAVSLVLLGLVLIAFCFWLWQRDSSLARFASLLTAIAGIAVIMALIHMPGSSKESLRSKAEPFSPAKLEELRKAGKPVFVDATADWCITCKVNETVALSSPDIMHVFADNHITYMVADWTHGDEDITHYLESFGRRGVPIYVYYPPNNAEPLVLPQLLSETIVLKVIAP